MELLSSEYGWLPDDIRNMRLTDINDYMTIIKVKRKEQENNLKKHGRK